MAAGIIHIVTGIIFVVVGVLIWKKKMISLLHNYHTEDVPEENIKAFARLVGIGVLIIGIGMLVSGIWIFLRGQMLGFLCFVASFIIGFSILLYSVIKYNR